MRRVRLPLDILVAALFLFACGSEVFADGVVIKVVNDSPSKIEMTLSDLIVYSNTQKQTVLKPSDASDDIKVGFGVQKLFDLNFTPTKYVISVMAGDSEIEATVFNISLVEPVKIPMLIDPNNGSPLFLAIDQSLYNFEPPADGTVLSFSMGVNPNLPGWFVGTIIDFETGNISGPYTGDALVDSTVEVSAVPEPATLLLLSSGVAAIAIKLRRRRGSLS